MISDEREELTLYQSKLLKMALCLFLASAPCFGENPGTTDDINADLAPDQVNLEAIEGDQPLIPAQEPATAAAPTPGVHGEVEPGPNGTDLATERLFQDCFTTVFAEMEYFGKAKASCFSPTDQQDFNDLFRRAEDLKNTRAKRPSAFSERLLALARDYRQFKASLAEKLPATTKEDIIWAVRFYNLDRLTRINEKKITSANIEELLTGKYLFKKPPHWNEATQTTEP